MMYLYNFVLNVHCLYHLKIVHLEYPVHLHDKVKIYMQYIIVQKVDDLFPQVHFVKNNITRYKNY